jgi:hypothetical protein
LPPVALETLSPFSVLRVTSLLLVSESIQYLW